MAYSLLAWPQYLLSWYNISFWKYIRIRKQRRSTVCCWTHSINELYITVRIFASIQWIVIPLHFLSRTGVTQESIIYFAELGWRFMFLHFVLYHWSNTYPCVYFIESSHWLENKFLCLIVFWTTLYLCFQFDQILPLGNFFMVLKDFGEIIIMSWTKFLSRNHNPISHCLHQWMTLITCTNSSFHAHL